MFIQNVEVAERFCRFRFDLFFTLFDFFIERADLFFEGTQPLSRFIGGHEAPIETAKLAGYSLKLPFISLKVPEIIEQVELGLGVASDFEDFILTVKQDRKNGAGIAFEVLPRRAIPALCWRFERFVSAIRPRNFIFLA